MIFGIGIDIVAISRMEKNIRHYQDRFAKKILSDKEMSIYSGTMSQDHFLAKHFAAKEAFVKALGTGFSKKIFLKDISIDHTESGQPLISYNEKLSKYTKSEGIISCHLSISDEKEYACAFVVLEK